MEKERNTLEIGKKEADLYLRKEREVAQEQGTLYQFYLYEGRKKKEAVSNQLDETTRKLEETRVSVGCDE